MCFKIKHLKKTILFLNMISFVLIFFYICNTFLNLNSVKLGMLKKCCHLILFQFITPQVRLSLNKDAILILNQHWYQLSHAPRYGSMSNNNNNCKRTIKQVISDFIFTVYIAYYVFNRPPHASVNVTFETLGKTTAASSTVSLLIPSQSKIPKKNRRSEK